MGQRQADRGCWSGSSWWEEEAFPGALGSPWGPPCPATLPPRCPRGSPGSLPQLPHLLPLPGRRGQGDSVGGEVFTRDGGSKGLGGRGEDEASGRLWALGKRRLPLRQGLGLPGPPTSHSPTVIRDAMLPPEPAGKQRGVQQWAGETPRVPRPPHPSLAASWGLSSPLSPGVPHTERARGPRGMGLMAAAWGLWADWGGRRGWMGEGTAGTAVAVVSRHLGATCGCQCRRCPHQVCQELAGLPLPRHGPSEHVASQYPPAGPGVWPGGAELCRGNQASWKTPRHWVGLQLEEEQPRNLWPEAERVLKGPPHGPSPCPLPPSGHAPSTLPAPLDRCQSPGSHKE